MKILILCILAALLAACTTSTPRRVENICHIFEDKRSWYRKAKKAEKRWGSSISTMMAVIYQESRFQAKAKPPRTKILWLIPGPRKSDAYGYPQAKDATWDWYKKSSGNRRADRDDFGDAIDFVGWYNAQTNKNNRVRLNDTYNLYLAYHEGHGGHRRGTYKNKAWLVKVANRVKSRANTYQQQLQGCEKRLNRGSSILPF